MDKNNNIKIIITNEKGDQLQSTAFPLEDPAGLFSKIVCGLLNKSFTQENCKNLSVNIKYDEQNGIHGPSVTINMFAPRTEVNHEIGQITFSHNERFRICDDCEDSTESLYFHPELFYDRD